MKSFSTEFKVGLFTILAVVVVVYMMKVLSPVKDVEYNEYYTILDNARGILVKSQIKTNGVLVGQVREVKLANNNTRISLMIDASVKIPKGSKLEIRSRGLLGDVYIEVMRSKDDGKYIKNEGYVPHSTESVDLQTMMALFGSIAQDIKSITKSLVSSMGPDGNSSVTKIVENIESVSSSLNGMINENRNNFKELIANLKTSSEKVENALGGDGNRLSSIMDSLDRTSRNFNEFSANAKRVLNDENTSKIENLFTSLDSSIKDINETTSKIRLVASKIERGEGTLGRLLSDDTALIEIEGAIQDIREVIAPATKLKIGVDYHSELQNDKSNKNHFNLLFRTSPDKYYVLGITESNQDNILTSTTSTVQNSDGSVTEVESTSEDKQIELNLQFAKRWYFLTGKFGLFEGSGGFGSDMHFWGDRLRLGLEIFDFDTEDNSVRELAHVRTFGQMLFFGHLYVIGGVDDVTRKGTEDNPNYFFGAGFSFDDQDLKALFGVASLAQ